MPQPFLSALHGMLERWKEILGSLAAIVIILLQILSMIETSGAHHLLGYVLNNKADTLQTKSDQLATLVQHVTNGVEANTHGIDDNTRAIETTSQRAAAIQQQISKLQDEIKAIEALEAAHH